MNDPKYRDIVEGKEANKFERAIEKKSGGN
jgi:hypothetical protein